MGKVTGFDSSLRLGFITPERRLQRHTSADMKMGVIGLERFKQAFLAKFLAAYAVNPFSQNAPIILGNFFNRERIGLIAVDDCL